MFHILRYSCSDWWCKLSSSCFYCILFCQLRASSILVKQQPRQWHTHIRNNTAALTGHFVQLWVIICIKLEGSVFYWLYWVWFWSFLSCIINLCFFWWRRGDSHRHVSIWISEEMSNLKLNLQSSAADSYRAVCSSSDSFVLALDPNTLILKWIKY